MLEFIRKRSASILIKVLFGLLILSFLTWGIGDFVRGRATDRTVADVGGVEISPDQLNREYLREINRMEQLFGTRLDRDQARALGLVEATLGRIVNDTLWSLGASSMGVTTSDFAVRAAIARDRAFMDQTGTFNRSQFEQTLLSNGLSEQSYVAMLRQRMARYQVADSVDTGVTTPKSVVEAIYRQSQEKRIVETLFVADSAMTRISEPMEDDLVKFHSETPRPFTAPEYRKLTILNLLAKDLQNEVTVTDEEIQNLYDQRQGEFDRAEMRRLSQIVVPDEETAKEAYRQITEGADFVQIAKDVAGMDEATVDIGDVSRNMLLAELADAAFGLSENEISQPVKSPLGWHLLRVDAITPAYKQPIDDARAVLTADIAREKSIDALFELANQVEDTLGGGATLEEVSASLNLTIRQVSAVDTTGRDAAGNPVADLPPGGTFLRTAFETPEGTDSLLTEAGTDGYFILRVDAVTLSALRPLADVRQDVADAWRSGKRAEKAKETAEALTGRLVGSTTMADLAAELGVEAKTVDAFIRSNPPADSGLSPMLVRDLFAAKTGGTVSGRSGNGYVVAQVKEIVPANPGTDSAGVTAIKDALTNSLKGDIQAQFSAALREDFPVEINQRALDQTF